MTHTEHPIDVEKVLNTLGIRNVKTTGTETSYSCPGPTHRNGDARASAYMKGSYPHPFVCFGCGSKGTIQDFVAEFKGVSRNEALKWIGEVCGFKTGWDPDASVTETLNRIFGPKSKPEHIDATNSEIGPYVGINFNPLFTVDVALQYLLKRGLEEDTTKVYSLQFDSFSGRIAIPYYRAGDGLVVGFKARDITGQSEAKYLVLGDRDKHVYGFKPFNPSMELYGFNHWCHKVYDEIIVVEGEFNAMRVHQAGFENVVGLPTAHMSVWQSSVIREKFEKVVLYLDDDEAGQRGVITATNMLTGACKVKVVPSHTKDAMDSEDDEIGWLIQNAESTLMNRLKRLDTRR